MQASVFLHNGVALDTGIREILEAGGFACQTQPLPGDHESLAASLEGKHGGLVVLPAIWEDLYCVKAVQEIMTLPEPFECAAVGAIPAPDVLTMAFNEGLAALLQPDMNRTMLERAVKRLKLRVQRRREIARLLAQDGAPQAGSPPYGLSPRMQNRDHMLGSLILKMLRAKASPFAGKATALIVSTSESQRKPLVAMLAELGLGHEVCGGVAQAVDKVAHGGYTIVISDLMLPDGEASELAQKLRKLPLPRFPRFLVWSSSPEKAAALLRPGTYIDEVVLKPSQGVGLEALIPPVLCAVHEALL